MFQKVFTMDDFIAVKKILQEAKENGDENFEYDGYTHTVKWGEGLLEYMDQFMPTVH